MGARVGDGLNVARRRASRSRSGPHRASAQNLTGRLQTAEARPAPRRAGRRSSRRRRRTPRRGRHAPKSAPAALRRPSPARLPARRQAASRNFPAMRSSCARQLVRRMKRGPRSAAPAISAGSARNEMRGGRENTAAACSPTASCASGASAVAAPGVLARLDQDRLALGRKARVGLFDAGKPGLDHFAHRSGVDAHLLRPAADW